MEATMKRIALAFAFSLISLAAFGQAAAPQVDCTEVCGTPTCCIAQSSSIAACSVTNRSAVARLRALAEQNKNDEIANICVGDTKTNGVNPIVPRKFGDRLKQITCNWGCCQTQTTLASLDKSPALAEKMFAGTSLASVGREITQKGTVSPEARKKIGQGMDGGFLCIFCCHF
jgi:hypothetical protein